MTPFLWTTPIGVFVPLGLMLLLGACTCATVEGDELDSVEGPLQTKEVTDAANYKSVRQYYIANGAEVLHGRQVVVGPDGKVASEEYYRRGVRHGMHTIFYADGRAAFQTSYSSGQEHGLRMTWNEVGFLVELEAFQFGKQDGPAFKWADTGQLAEECSFVDGALEGELTGWLSKAENRPWYRKEFHNGLQHGFERWWDESGTLIEEKFFENGLQISK